MDMEQQGSQMAKQTMQAVMGQVKEEEKKMKELEQTGKQFVQRKAFSKVTEKLNPKMDKALDKIVDRMPKGLKKAIAKTAEMQQKVRNALSKTPLGKMLNKAKSIGQNLMKAQRAILSKTPFGKLALNLQDSITKPFRNARAINNQLLSKVQNSVKVDKAMETASKATEQVTKVASKAATKTATKVATQVSTQAVGAALAAPTAGLSTVASTAINAVQHARTVKDAAQLGKGALKGPQPELLDANGQKAKSMVEGQINKGMETVVPGASKLQGTLGKANTPKDNPNKDTNMAILSGTKGMMEKGGLAKGLGVEI